MDQKVRHYDKPTWYRRKETKGKGKSKEKNKGKGAAKGDKDAWEKTPKKGEGA